LKTSTEYFIQQLHNIQFFSVVCGTYSKIIHILEQKSSLNNYKKFEISKHIVPDHNGMKVEIRIKRKHTISKYMETKQYIFKEIRDMETKQFAWI
jgi:hypothetical protein